MDALVSAETVDGGKLREAATRKSDESLLIHIADKDLVALEVKFINAVMKNTRRFLGTAQDPKPKNNMNANMKNPLMFFVRNLSEYK